MMREQSAYAYPRRPGRPLHALEVSASDRVQLAHLAQSRVRRMSCRANIIILAAQGLSNTEIARTLGTSTPTVGKWRERFRSRGLDGLYDDSRPGPTRRILDDTIEAIVMRTLTGVGVGGKLSSARSIARELGVSKSSVSRIWQQLGLSKRCSVASDAVGNVSALMGLQIAGAEGLLVCDVHSQVHGNRPVAHRPASRSTKVVSVRQFTPLNALYQATCPRHCAVLPRLDQTSDFLAYCSLSYPHAIPTVLAVRDTRSAEEARRWAEQKPNRHVHELANVDAWLGCCESIYSHVREAGPHHPAASSLNRLNATAASFLAELSRRESFSWTGR